MEENCYACGRPAPYFCEAAGCDHRMCHEHAVLRLLDSAQRASHHDEATDEEHALPADHEHLCVDHARSAS